MNNFLLSLLQLSDPALPIGGYAHSAGLETYVQKGIVKDVDTAASFIREMLNWSLRYTDAAFLSLAYTAAERSAFDNVIELDMLCTAVKLPLEMRMASQKLGTRLLKLFEKLYDDDLAGQYSAAVRTKTAAGHYSIAFGILAHALGVPKHAALTGFFYNATAAMVTNSVKLVPLSQQHGQELLFSLQPLISSLAEAAMQPDAALLGLGCPGFDIRCMQHESLYSRLYMS